MKISKLLMLGTVLVALCMAVPAFASQITLIKEIAATDPGGYLVGQTVHFECTVANPSTNTRTNTLTEIWDTLPDGTLHYFVSANPANNPDTTTALVQAPSASQTYYVNYVVAAADLVDLGGGYTGVVNYLNCLGTDSATPRPDVINAGTSKSAVVFTPDIAIAKIGSITAFCEGNDPNVTYTYYVENTGDEDINDVLVVDDTCGPLTGPTGDDGDGLLNPAEIWTYTCSMILTDTTFNIVEVNGVGLYTGAEVYDANEWLVEELPPPIVVVNPSEATICEANDVTLCAQVTGGVGPFTYAWTKDDSPLVYDTNCITVSAAGVYCVTVTDTETGCDANDCATLTVIPTPECSIDSGPTSLCEDAIGIPATYCTAAIADGYLWEIVDGNATIDGNDYEACVDIIPTSLGTITLKLSLYNEVPGDDDHCWNSCEVTITVEECGKTFCSFTQGFWGNKGGKACDGTKTADLIAGCVPITVGLPGHSITLGTAQCIIDLLPAGGTPAVLPAGDFTCATIPASLKNKQGRFNNVLIGQVVALTLNLCVSDGCVEDSGVLADWILPVDFCTVPYGNEEACAEYSMIPDKLAGLSVSALLAEANKVLAGQAAINDASIGDIYNAVTAINEGFDECRTVVPCIRPEICGNGCDDDGDGLVDGDDPDCQPQ